MIETIVNITTGACYLVTAGVIVKDILIYTYIIDYNIFNYKNTYTK